MRGWNDRSNANDVATSHGRVEGYARRERPKRCARRRTVSSVNAEKARQIRTEERGPFDKPIDQVSGKTYDVDDEDENV